MRLKPFNSVFLLLVCGALAYSFPLNAQEGRAQAEIEGTTKETPRNDSDPIGGSESETRSTGKTTPAITSPKDSIQVKTVTAKPVKPAEKTPKEEEDPLSFNFLYYIIEKFKLSDIIE